MHMRALAMHICKLITLFLFIVLLTLSGAYGQNPTALLRIGLQTQQAEVQLQGTTPLVISAAGLQDQSYPAGQPLVFDYDPTGVKVHDAAGKLCFISATPVKIAVDATQIKAGADTPAPLPAIQLLGPTRHYDHKADRPYRGAFEVFACGTGLTVVNVVNVEDYLLGVVSSEMSPGYPIEALKAQAIAARTYALKHIGRLAAQGYDLDDTPACQVYGGIPSEDPRTARAVQETAGQVLTYQGALIDAVYSSTCGGITESAEEAWGKRVPYLVSVPDAPDTPDQPFTRPATEQDWATFFKTTNALNCLQPKYAKPEAFRWIKILTRQELEAGLPEQYRVGTVTAITPVTRGDSGRITSLRLVGSDRTVTIDQELPIRKAFGNLRSSAFSVDMYPDDRGTPVVFVFWGGGYGHGLGMCQVGAVGLAEQGWDYRKILGRYYQGATIETRG